MVKFIRIVFCRTGNHFMPTTEFSGKRTVCNKCSTKQANEWVKQHPDEHRAHSKASSRKLFHNPWANTMRLLVELHNPEVTQDRIKELYADLLESVETISN